MPKNIEKITSCLWFDRGAEEAAKFYTSIFNNSSIGKITHYGKEGYDVHHMPAGTVLTVEFELEGETFTALNGGPVFKFTPAISFFVNCSTLEEIDKLWARLSEGGAVLMELQKYPFSEKFGWLQDKYGLSWQLNRGVRSQKITPFLMFSGAQHGKAEEAMNFYTAIFANSRIQTIERYAPGEQGVEGKIKHAIFSLGGQELGAMESNRSQFSFNEAVSLVVTCETQEEIDFYWSKLSLGGDEKAQQCGWLKDKYGVSWQVVPRVIGELVGDPDSEKSQRAMKAMLQMKKLDLGQLMRAYQGYDTPRADAAG